MGKQYWKDILPKVLELEAQGYSHRTAAEELGYTQKQIKKLIERYHKNQRKPMQLPAKRGRPRKRVISEEREYQVRINQLEMENELLRSFLQAVGRM
jgi:transposase